MSITIIEDADYWRAEATRRGWYCAGFFVLAAAAVGALLGVVVAGGPK